jgi:hypothetical protein
MHLNCLAIKVEGFLRDNRRPLRQVMHRHVTCGVGEITPSARSDIFGKTLESLTVTPCSANAVNFAVIPVVVPPFAQNHLLSYSVIGLRFW